MNCETELIKTIENNWLVYNKSQSISVENLDQKWGHLVQVEPTKFLLQGKKIKSDALRNFRYDQIFIPDAPYGNTSKFNAKNWIGGGRRGTIRLLKDMFSVLQENHYLDLLKKYPVL